MPSLLLTSHPTIPDTLTFVTSALIILGGGVGVISARNPVHAALSLVATLFGVAVLFVEEQADFLAVVQVIVYAGAIVVLFLFVIMYLGVDRRENVFAEPLKGQRPIALVLVLIIAGGVIALGVNAHWATGEKSVTGSTLANHHSNVYQLGQSVFTTYLYAFEATAALLVIAVVGAVVLARRPRLVASAEREEALAAGAGQAGAEEPAADALTPAEESAEVPS
jgi:NADH-quinone oxidoreductase subunit J